MVSSNHADYQPGDWVLGYSGWQDYELSDGSGLVKLVTIRNTRPVAGSSGDARLHRLHGFAGHRPAKGGRNAGGRRGDRAGGATVGQIGKMGCRTVGIAGGAENAAMRLRR